MNFKKLLYSFSTLLIILIITGCSATKVDEGEKIGEFDNAPTWINTKQLQGKVSELGSSSKGELTFRQQRDSAIQNAKESLANKLQVKVINIFKLLKDPTIEDAEYHNKVAQESKAIVLNATNNSKIMKLWKSNSQTIYVLMSSDIQEIKKDFKNSLQTTFKDMEAINSNYTLQLEQGNIDIELSN